MPDYPDDDQLRAWDFSTMGHERAAAVVARWVHGRPRWEMVPGMDAFGIDAPQVTFTKALNMLVRLGVLARDGRDYFVAAGG